MIKKITSLKKILEIGSGCKKCGHCCSLGSGALAKGDSKKISKFLNISEKRLKETFLEEAERFNTKLMRPKILREGKPYGKCIFLGDKKVCRINSVKPLECRVGNCSEHGESLSLWFMLNYSINPSDPESIRQYASYLKSGGKTLEGGSLESFVPDKKKLSRMLSYDTL